MRFGALVLFFASSKGQYTEEAGEEEEEVGANTTESVVSPCHASLCKGLRRD